jgi:hypothetical protein
MKTNEEIIKEAIREHHPGRPESVIEAMYTNISMYSQLALTVKAMRLAKIEAVKATLEVAANNVCMVHHDGRTKLNHNLGYFQNGADNIKVDKNSILMLDPAAIILEMEGEG